MGDLELLAVFDQFMCENTKNENWDHNLLLRTYQKLFMNK